MSVTEVFKRVGDALVTTTLSKSELAVPGLPGASVSVDCTPGCPAGKEVLGSVVERFGNPVTVMMILKPATCMHTWYQWFATSPTFCFANTEYPPPVTVRISMSAGVPGGSCRFGEMETW